MPVHSAPGLPADWLNGWLAAIGVTVVLPDALLAWSDDPVPRALVHHPADDLAAALFTALPTEEQMTQHAIARRLGDTPELKRSVPLDVYRARASLARSQRDDTLSATLTDLAADADAKPLPHSPFDAPAPKGITLWQRAVSCRGAIHDADKVRATLRGHSSRIVNNGLGFDVRRIDARAENVDNMTDPAVELLAYCALALFPVRGDGQRQHTRGWDGPALRRGSFQWGTWRPPLDRWSIDAWLDRLYADRRPGCTARFVTVPYQPRGSNDVTRAYAAERRL